ncbi:hypothetical protein PBY51_022796 [Eleginops maclovinus]|uniref:Polycystic kidney disease protein 1-like 2 n=1 Tax=Eleginops maclovinus TaxID=56733 RepID=A0AAN7XFZ3_ELEMC|nr:hypothetical protein PBY51_022796 [Eleginops maclovinus]
MRWTIVHLLCLMTLSCMSCSEDKTPFTVSCPDYQRAFGGSCYEFVDLQHTFFSAQAWCEQRGGHLGFIPDEETQYFLQRLLNPKKDVWLGVAASLPTNLQYSPTAEARCNNREVCQLIANVVDLFGEPCPQMGSYLSVDYHCKDGLMLSVSTVAAVFDEVTIQVKWLLYPPQEKLSCKLGTGDGHVLYLPNSERLESSKVHIYTYPGTFVVEVECTSKGIHITAQSVITIQEPITMFGVIRCYAGKQSFHSTNCKALHGEPFQIQMELKAGTNVTYRMKRDNVLLSRSFVVRGNVPENITVSPEMIQQHGLGCHHLTLYASNMVTSSEVSMNMQVCVLEKVTGLQASVLTDGEDCLDSKDVTVAVTLEKGTPVLLRFYVTGNNRSYSETKELNAGRDIFHIGPPIQGSVQVKIRAWNAFSSIEVEVDTFAFCVLESVIKQHRYNDILLTPQKKHLRVARASKKIELIAIATPPVVIPTTITLSTSKQSEVDTNNIRYWWTCTEKSNPCGCDGEFEGLEYTIQGDCLPAPFQYYKYYFKDTDKGKQNKDAKKGESICITFTLPLNEPSWLSFTCIQGCNPVRENTDAIIKMTCSGKTCPTVLWNIQAPREKGDWPEEIKAIDDCYKDTYPLIETQNGNVEYTVNQEILEKAKKKKRNVTVVITSVDVNRIYKEIIIITSRTPERDDQNPDGTTAGNGDGATTPAGPASTSPVTISQSSRAPNNPNNPATAPTISPASKSPSTLSGPTITPVNPISPISSTTPYTNGPATKLPGTVGDNTATPTTANPSDTSPPTTYNTDNLKCSISPESGTILDAFDITCTTEIPCSDCQYCFKAQDGKHLLCSNNNEVKSVFLPLGNSSYNYTLIIKATAINSSYEANTTITAEVLDFTEDDSSSVDGLNAAVDNAMALLKKQGLLSGEYVGQIFSSVSKKLNSQSDEANQADRKKLREKMMAIITDTVKEVPIQTPEGIQVIARGLAALVQRGTELSSSAQENASILLADLSSYLLHMDVYQNGQNVNEMQAAASTIVEGASNILDFPSNKNVSDALLLALSNTQSALLACMDDNKGPTVIQQAHIALFVYRSTMRSLHTDSIHIPNSYGPSFSLPALPSNILSSDEPVGVGMLSMDKNPFSWNKGGNISGITAALSLTTTNGSSIAVENLSENIKILLPRPVGEQVNSSVLHLGNFSTMIIDVASADSTLVLKMVPSNDPLPFKILLGYMDFPTEINNVAMTEMPHDGATQEERYTWLLEPKDLKGNTGVHYLVVRPIVGPGIKSINATLTFTSISTACRFWDESKLDWSTDGCKVGVHSTHLVTECLCNHLTFFGSSFFVTPNLVDPSRTAELFASFAENPLVVCFVASLFGAYLLVIVWARRKDIKDTVKVKVTVLDDNYPMDEYRYLLSVSTGHRRKAATSSEVTITLMGSEGSSEPHHLTDSKKCVFERGAVDLFLLTTPFSLGDLQGIRLWHNNSGSHPAWYVGNVMVQDLQTEQKCYFLCNSWLALDIGDCSLDKVFPVSTEMDLKRFSNLFFMKTSKDFSDGHLWYSVINRPPSSNFTCVQRVSCCFTLLLCTMLTSVMFYGIPTDPSEQTMDMGLFEFTWQQFMIGVQSSLIMFPVNILIVSIFRNTRPRETFCCKRKTKKTDAERLFFSQTNTANMSVNVTLDTVIMNIKRVAQSLSKTMKSNIPCTESEFGPAQQVDINAVLSTVEQFIKMNNKTSDTAQPQLAGKYSTGHG